MHKKRLRYKKNFLLEAGWLDASAHFLAGDASNRHYERLSFGKGETAILMDAPDACDSTKAFVDVAHLLSRNGFSAPEILAYGESLGFILLEDLGDLIFNLVLKDKNKEEPLFSLLMELITAVQSIEVTEKNVPKYTWNDLSKELDVFTKWGAPSFLNRALSNKEAQEFNTLWHDTFLSLPVLPEVLVLRDCHVDNFMWIPQRQGIKKIGLLDFQDARMGSPSYDIVSILQDARYDVPEHLEANMISKFIKENPQINEEEFSQHYAWFGAQRSTKIIGIFTRLAFRDGKKRYLQHIPRVWRWVSKDLQHPLLAPVKEWFDHVMGDNVRERSPRHFPLVSHANS